MSSAWNDFRIPMTWGDTRNFRVTVAVAGAAQNIATWTNFWCTAKLAISDLDAAAIFQKTLASGITVVSAATGVIEVEIASSDTALLTLQTKTHSLYTDVQGKDGAGKIRTLARGRIIVCPQSTRATS